MVAEFDEVDPAASDQRNLKNDGTEDGKAVKSDDDESRFAASAGRVFTAEEDRLQKIEMQKLIATSPKLQELLAGGLMKDMGRNPVEAILK